MAPGATYLVPPIEELALSIQFKSLEGLVAPRVGKLWAQKFASHLPRLEEHPPIQEAIERFEPPKPHAFSFKWETGAQPNRVWMLSESGTELLQVQQNRMVSNWRKQGTSAQYPKYHPGLREKTLEAWRHFSEFVNKEGLGELIPNQCEVTYVDHIPIEDLPGGEGWPGQLLTCMLPTYEDPQLGQTEEASCSLVFRLSRAKDHPPYGRLRFSAKPKTRKADGKKVLVLNTVARGAPEGPSEDLVFETLDLLQKEASDFFKRVTTQHMQDLWKGKK